MEEGQGVEAEEEVEDGQEVHPMEEDLHLEEDDIQVQEEVHQLILRIGDHLQDHPLLFRYIMKDGLDMKEEDMTTTEDMEEVMKKDMEKVIEKIEEVTENIMITETVTKMSTVEVEIEDDRVNKIDGGLT